MPDVKGQLAMVTGASSGLGEATAVRLAELGARVALLARSESGLDRVAARISGAGGAAFALPADLADPDAVVAAAGRVISSAGRPRVLVNAAATDAPGPAEEMPVADWQRVIAVNLTAPFLLSRAVFPHMRAAGGGIIVNVSSVAGRRGWASASAYCATKFGLTGLTQTLAAEGAPHSIRVVCLYPGAMATRWGTWSAADRDQPRRTAPEDSLPPEDVAGYIAWLVCAPAHVIVTEAVIAPIRERGWP
jgi:NAD(P)-dependent dehydrogenase (short-subunit alcohol dehydrogenase family)